MTEHHFWGLGALAILVTLGTIVAAPHVLAVIGVVMDHLFGLGCC